MVRKPHKSPAEEKKMVGTWLGEICSSTCFQAYKYSAWLYLDHAKQDLPTFFAPLYALGDKTAQWPIF